MEMVVNGWETGTRVTRPNQHTGKQSYREDGRTLMEERGGREKTTAEAQSIHNKQGKDENQPDGADTEKNSKSSVV